MEAFGADVAAVVDELDLERVVLVGHSMGGDVIVEAARKHHGAQSSGRLHRRAVVDAGGAQCRRWI